MGEKVTIINKLNDRQINAYHLVSRQAPCIWNNMLHMQARRQVRCTCRRYGLSPKKNVQPLNGVCILYIYNTNRGFSYASINRSKHLLHIDCLNIYGLRNRQDNYMRHLLWRAFPSCCLSFLQMSSFLTLPHCRLSKLHKRLLLCVVNLYCHNCHLYNIRIYPCNYAKNSTQIHFFGTFLYYYHIYSYYCYFFSYNPCITINNIIKNNIDINKNIYGFECFGTKQKLPLPKTGNSPVKGEGRVMQVYPLGIGPITCTLSNILGLGWEGLSWNITPCAAPSMLRSLTPALRVETMGGGNLAEFPLNVRQKENAPAIRTGIGLQRHIYIVPKHSYLFYVFAILALNQKALQRYDKTSEAPNSVNENLTIGLNGEFFDCRNNAVKFNVLSHNALCATRLAHFTVLFVVLNVVGSSPTGHPTIKPVDYQVISGLFCVQNQARPP